MSASLEDRLPAGSQISHYRIEKKIGEGGMGTVYLARDLLLRRSVALKVLPQSLSSDHDRLIRFEREAVAASALNHPNILTIHEIGKASDIHFIVSEYVKGTTLREKITSLTLESIVDIAVQIASSLEAANENGIVHRDIKPENIMVRDDGLVKVLDFGLAKLAQPRPDLIDNAAQTLVFERTEPGMVMGTASYMSPEQARGGEVDQRTDLWSLGVVLYEMLSGYPPFEGQTAVDIIASILNKEPPPLSRFDPNIPEALQRIVTKMLRKDRDKRYQTMKGLLADLKVLKEKITAAQKLEISAPPETEKETAVMRAVTGSSGERTNILRSVRSRPLLFVSALAALVIAASVLAWHWRRPAASEPAEIRSLAVLPLRSIDSGDNFLGLGIADAVIRKISQTGGLTVRPTSAVRRYLNEDIDALTAASQLRVDAILEGSFQRSGDRLRVSVNLLRTSDGASLWTDSWDMTSADVFKIEDNVAQQVASQLKLQLDPAQQARMQRKYTSNPAAYDHYVEGIYNLDQRGYGTEALPQMLTTIDLFKKAIEADPSYALAHAQLAYAYAWVAIMVDSTNPDWERLANQEIERSQDLDPQLAESHIARALLLWSAYNGYQNEAAVREVLFAQKLNPSVGHEDLAAWFGHMGLEDASAREKQLATDIDPTNPTVKHLPVILNFIGGRYDEYLKAVREIDPNAQPGAWYLLGKGRLDEAENAIGKYVAEGSDARDVPALRGILYALRGNFHAAEAQVPAAIDAYPANEQSRHHAYYAAACIYALAGNSKESVKWLRQAAVTGYPDYPLFERDHYLDRIRQTPEFIRFMAEMRSLNERYNSEFQ